jgi:hypothetical protein
MKKSYLKMIAFTAMMVVSANVFAIDPPLKSETLTEGNTYVLFSYANPSMVLSRDGWNGAYYLAEESASNYLTGTGNRTVPFTAHKADDGSWYFSVEENEMITSYVGIYNVGGNLLGNLEEPAYWEVENAPVDGFYMLKAKEQFNHNVDGMYLHLNSGCTYLVITYEGDSWFPDFYGGLQFETDVDDNKIYLLDEDGVNYVPNDPSSRYWAFVQVENVPSVLGKATLYAAIKNLEDNYADIEGYEKGFQDAIDAATKFYNTDPLYEEDIEDGLAIINSKINLYKEIQNAYDVLGDGSDVGLEKAIEAATNQFNLMNNPTDINNAIETLKKAVTDFQMGTGEVTSLGSNMSFEDLSSQNGEPTSSVQGAPAGWNLYINGKQVVTADEVRSAGVGAWCGINADGTGAKDQTYIFGIWNSGIPKIELSQTIEGLENGTYTITAAVMVGANGAGSRRTTQRIFGNLNSKYFGSQDEYNLDLLDKSEIYDFEGLTEPTTDTELQDMSVEAFVYDGTLTFGFRTDNNIAAANRDSGNGAGGDGWFKIDNFRIVKEEFNADAALAIYDHYKEELSELLDGNYAMQKSVRDNAEDILKNKAVDASSSQEEIIASFLALKDAYPVVKSSIDAYQKFAEAIDNANATLEEYGNSLGADAFGDVIMEAEEAYDDATVDEAGVDEIIANLIKAADEMKKQVIEAGQDITDLVVKNPSFEDLSSQNGNPADNAQPAPAGWNLYINGELQTGAPAGLGWCAINHGDNIEGYGATDEEGNVIGVQYVDGTHVWGIWNGSIPEVELSQELSLPAGTYTLTCNMMVEYQWAQNCITTQRLFANNYICMFACEEDYEFEELPEDAQLAKSIDDAGAGDLKLLNFAGYTCTDGDPTVHLLRPMSLTFGVDEDGAVKFGFRTDGNIPASQMDGNDAGAGWFKLDNFRLSYDSEGIPTALKDVKAITDASRLVNGQEYYTVGGARLAAPQKGVNIVKTTLSDGSVKVSKVFNH